MQKSRYSLFKFLSRLLWTFIFAVAAGMFISVFSMGASTVQAAEQVQENAVVISEEEVPLDESADNAGGAVFLLLGGMLVIIIAVVISVVASVVVTAPIADEI